MLRNVLMICCVCLVAFLQAQPTGTAKLKLKEIKCRLADPAILETAGNYKVIIIRNQQEFDQYLILEPGQAPVNFEFNMVMLAMTDGKKSKNIDFIGAHFYTKGRSLTIGVNLDEGEKGQFVVVSCSPVDFKKYGVLKGKLYQMNLNAGE